MSDINGILSADHAAALGAQLFENSPDCMKLLDPEGRILAMNANGRAAMEIDDFEAIRGASWPSFFPEASRPALACALEQARCGGTGRVSAFCPTARGTPKWWDIAVSALRDGSGVVRQLVAVSRDVTAAQQARRELETSEARFRSLVTASSAMVWHVGVSGQFETGQPGWAALTGQAFEEYRGSGWLDAVHPDDRAATALAWQRALDSGTPHMTEHRLRGADGNYRHMSVRAVPIRDAAGVLVEWVGVHTDITEQVLARIALHASRERFEKIVSQAATGVIEMDVDGRITLVNQKFCGMLGYGEAELLGTSVLGITAPDSVELTQATVQRVTREGNGQVIDKHYRRRDGSLLSATSSVNALRDADGACHGLVAIVLDTTASKRAAEALRASEERFRTLFDSMDQAFCLLELQFDGAGAPVDWVYLETNAAFKLQTGLADVVGKTRSQMLPGGDAWWLDTVGRVAREGGDLRIEHESTALGRWFDVYLTRVGGAGSSKVAALFRDITERRIAEQQLRRLADDLAETDRRKTDFLATLAHELRNPLAPIRSGLGLMRLNKDTSPALARVRDVMERQVSHMVHLIDDLLDVARISGGKLHLRKAHVALAPILASAVETSLPLIEAARHALSVDIADDGIAVEADATRIAQVVANLLNNAAKYTPPGGRIALVLRREGSQAVIPVTDTGVGIPPGALLSVFDMFSQVSGESERSQGGLGIGLSLVRQLVEMHGGSVVAESAGGGAGSRFTVRLPLAEGSADAPAAPAASGAGKAPAGLNAAIRPTASRPLCACWSWTTTSTPRSRWRCCSKPRGMRPKWRTADAKRWAGSPRSGRRSRSSTSACPT
jgi:PAS domain S-box-containing protein